MLIQINHILEGWGNVVKDKFDLLPPEKKEKSAKRLQTCNGCLLRNNNTCSTKKKSVVVKDFFYNHLNQHRKQGEIKQGCGCNLSAKSLCEDCQCPLGKWENL